MKDRQQGGCRVNWHEQHEPQNAITASVGIRHASQSSSYSPTGTGWREDFGTRGGRGGARGGRPYYTENTAASHGRKREARQVDSDKAGILSSPAGNDGYRVFAGPSGASLYPGTISDWEFRPLLVDRPRKG